MKARLLAVQRTLYLLVVASLVVAAASFPRGRNREYMAALGELDAFKGAFDQKKLEGSLLDYARSQGMVGLDQIAAQVERVRGPGVPKLKVAPDAAKIVPRAKLELATLGAVLEHMRGATTLELRVLDPAALGSALAWRLPRLTDGAAGQAPAPAVELRRVTLGDGEVSDEEVAREPRVAAERLAALESDKTLAKATAQLKAAEDLYDQRRKWKVSWKMMLKADEGRKEGRAALAAATSDRDHKYAAYEKDAKAAEAFAPHGSSDAAHAVANVTLAIDGKERTIAVPVALAARQATLPAIKGIGLSATQAAGLWDEVKDRTPAEAALVARSHFTWHYRYVQLGGLKVGGMTLLHLLPLLLPAILFMLLRHIKRVSISYNPFGVVEAVSLPRVGLPARALDALALSILPFTAAILTTIALVSISEIPVLPLLSGFLALGLGAYVFVELGSLQSLIDAVSRSHSTPPPPPKSK